MGVTIENEVYIFYVSLVCGVLCGVILDIFRAFHRTVKTGTASVAVQDIIFWLILSGVVFAYMYKFNNGQPRLYIFIGIGTGLVLYLLSVSKYIVAFLKKTFVLLFFLLKFLCRVILIPVKILCKPFKFIIKLLSKLNKKICALFQKIKFRIKKIKKVVKMY